MRKPSATVLLGLPVAILSGCQVLQPSFPFLQGAQSPAPNTAPSHQKRTTSASGKASRGSTADASAQLTVNDETIDAKQMWRELGVELSKQANEMEEERFQTFVKQKASSWIGQKVTEMLLYQKAAAGLTPDVEHNIDRFVDGEIRKIITLEHGGSQHQYEKHLGQAGVSLDDIRAKFRREVIIRSFLDAQIRPKVVEPTRSELWALFEENIDTWRREPRRSMSLIDIRIDRFATENADSTASTFPTTAHTMAKTRAEEALSKIRQGTPFADVARQYSNDLHAEEGGAWGWVKPGSLRERFAPAVEVLYRLQAGEVGNIIETKRDVFLVRCDEIDLGYEPSFPDVQEKLLDRRFRIEYNRLVGDLVSDLRKKAHIEPTDSELFYKRLVEATLRKARELKP